MSKQIGTGNRPPSEKAVHATTSTAVQDNMFSLPASGTTRKSRSWNDMSKMAPDTQKMASASKRSATLRETGNSDGAYHGTKGLGNSKDTRRYSGVKGVLNREKLSNGLSSEKISINISEAGDSDNDDEEARDNCVFSPNGNKPLVSILKIPGRGRSQSLPPNMILQQLSEVSSLGSNSRLAQLLNSKEPSEKGSTENLGLPAGPLFVPPRKVSFSLPRDSSSSSSGGSNSSIHLLPPLVGGGGTGGLLGPNLRGGSPYSYDGSSSESLDTDSRPSSAPKEIQAQAQQRTAPLPTGSSIFQMAMAEYSDGSDKNSESSDSEEVSNHPTRSRNRTIGSKARTTQQQQQQQQQQGTKQYLTPELRSSYSLSPRRLSNPGASPRRVSQSNSVSPRRPTPSSSVSPRRPSKTDNSGSRRT